MARTKQHPDLAEPPGEPRRRRGCLFRALVAGSVVVLVLVGLVAAVVLYTRTHQDLALPPSGAPIPTSPPRPAKASAAMVSVMTLKQGDTDRHVTILTPPDVAPGERLPLVILLHGHAGNAGSIVADGEWQPHIISDRFVLAAPEGISQSWNAGGCCRLATTLGVQDVAWLDAIVADLSARPTVDPSRVFMVGMSNGGMMTYRYLCGHADRLTAAVSVEGTDVAGCTPSRALPLLHIAGTADRVVPYDGGRSTAGAVLASGAFPAVEPSVANIADAAGCAATPTRSRAPGVETRTWSACRRGATVQLVTVDGLQHEWPKGSPYDATSEILRFLGIGT
jgi:polyhydroxybutyrate depolymerase